MKKIIVACLIMAEQTGYAQDLSGTFETWRSVPVVVSPGAGIECPTKWNSTDSIIFMASFPFPSASFKRQVFRSPDSHSGDYSVKLITASQDTLGVLPALLTNAGIGIDMTSFDPGDPFTSVKFTGGTPIHSQVGGIDGWIKYFPMNMDTATISVSAIITHPPAPDTVVSTCRVNITGTTPVWTHISVPLTYSTSLVPNLLQVYVASSTRYSATDSSTLYVDDMNIIDPLGIGHNTEHEKICSFFPNPCTRLLNIGMYRDENALIQIYGIDGKLVFNEMGRNGKQISVSNWVDGLYFLQVRSVSGVIQRECFTVAKQ